MELEGSVNWLSPPKYNRTDQHDNEDSSQTSQVMSMTILRRKNRVNLRKQKSLSSHYGSSAPLQELHTESLKLLRGQNGNIGVIYIPEYNGPIYG